MGTLFGGTLIWSFSDALHWVNFKKHVLTELIFVGIPFLLALLSPRKQLALFIGFSLILFRCIFLIFLFQNIWTATATVLWLVLLVWLGAFINRRYAPELARLPDDITVVEFLLVGTFLGVAFYALYLLRRTLGLG